MEVNNGKRKYALEAFLREYNNNAIMFSIEDENLITDIKGGQYPQEGMGSLSRLVGFLGQRLWFGHKTKNIRCTSYERR